MASKKDLKKTINYICSELFAECVATSLYRNKKDKDDADALLSSILMIHSNYISRISHPEPGLPASRYYNQLIADFNKDTGDIIDQIVNLG